MFYDVKVIILKVKKLSTFKPFKLWHYNWFLIYSKDSNNKKNLSISLVINELYC